MSNFAPELLAFFLRGYEGPFSVELPNEKDAHSMRFRLHNLRRAMRKTNHPELPKVERVSLHIDGKTLTAQPKDQRFVEVLRSAGIKADEALTIQEPNLTSAEDASLSKINEFLQKG